MPLPESVVIKVERAREHLTSLKRDVRARHREFESQGIVQERDPKNGDWIWVMRAHPDSLRRINKLAGDYIHNLRSALDHLIYQMSAERTHRPLPEFPVYETAGPGAGAFHDAGVKKIWSIPIEAKAIIERVQPYNGGNQALLNIHTLDVIDKHRTLMTTTYAVNTASVRVRQPNQAFTDPETGREKVGFFVQGISLGSGRFKYGQVIARLVAANPPETIENLGVQFTFQIAVEEKGFSGEVVTKLSPLYDYVESELLPQFEPFFK